MRKVFGLFLAFALLMSMVNVAYAEYSAYSNAVYMGQGESTKPYQEIIRVRYGRGGTVTEQSFPTLASGTVVAWDTNSMDGMTVSAIMATSPVSGVAGVLVTPLLTDDTVGFSSSDRSFGYMAVRGYALALVDTSLAETGRALVPSNDATVIGYFGTNSHISTSSDAGTLLQDTGSDGMMPVMLR